MNVDQSDEKPHSARLHGVFKVKLPRVVVPSEGSFPFLTFKRTCTSLSVYP